MKQIVASADEVGAGALDEELVHRLRIGLRRLRTVLRELGADRFGADAAWAPLLRRAYQELGRHRDRAVVLPAVCADLVAAGCSSPVATLPSRRTFSPEEVVRAPLFQKTLEGLRAFTHRAAEAGKTNARDDVPLRTFLAKQLRRLHRLLARDAGRFSELEPARQHRVRKRLGRLLCLGAFAAPMFERRGAALYLASWRGAEMDLGRNTDLRAAGDLLAGNGLDAPGARLASRWMRDWQASCVQHCQLSLREAMKRVPFWDL